MSDDDYELVEHPHEEVTHVDHPRYTSPISDVEESENPSLTTNTLDNLRTAAKLNCRSHLRAPVHTHGSMRSWFGVLVLMAILRLVGAPKHPTACSLPPSQGTMQTKWVGERGHSSELARIKVRVAMKVRAQANPQLRSDTLPHPPTTSRVSWQLRRGCSVGPPSSSKQRPAPPLLAARE